MSGSKYIKNMDTNRMHNSCFLFTNILVAFKHLINSTEVTICVLLTDCTTTL